MSSVPFRCYHTASDHWNPPSEGAGRLSFLKRAMETRRSAPRARLPEVHDEEQSSLGVRQLARSRFRALVDNGREPHPSPRGRRTHPANTGYVDTYLSDRTAYPHTRDAATSSFEIGSMVQSKARAPLFGSQRQLRATSVDVGDRADKSRSQGVPRMSSSPPPPDRHVFHVSGFREAGRVRGVTARARS